MPGPTGGSSPIDRVDRPDELSGSLVVDTRIEDREDVVIQDLPRSTIKGDGENGENDRSFL